MFEKSLVCDAQLHLQARIDQGYSTASHDAWSRSALIRLLGILAKSAQKTGVSPVTAVGTLLHMWCKSTYPGLETTTLPISPEYGKSDAATLFVDRLKALSFLEAAYWLSTAYARISDTDYRKKLAMFFTPVSLTNGLLNDLAEQGADFAKHRILDPACGGAAFLAPVALRMRDALRLKGWKSLQVLQHIETHLAGCDLDEVLCELSRHFLRMALYAEISETGYQPRFNVQRADSLTSLQPEFGKLDVVICNPPYRKLTATEAPSLRLAFSEVMEGQPNLYGLFISLCVKLLRKGGLAATVSPTSFLSGQYFSKLRVFLAQHVDIEHIGMVSDKAGVFMDVQQETALTILRRRRTKYRKGHNATAFTAKVSVVSPGGEYRKVGCCALPQSGQAWPIPRAESDVKLLGRTGLDLSRLRDYGYGIRIGAFVWNRDKRPRFETLIDAQAHSAGKAVPLLWSRNIRQGGTLQFDETEMFYGEHRFVDMGTVDHSSVVRNPSVILQRVTSNEQPRRLVCAAVTSSFLHRYQGFVGENHIVILEQLDKEPVLSPSELVALLSTTAVDRYFRCISGATNVSVFELSQLALPPAHALRHALDTGVDMADAVAQLMAI